jgi:uncharacterized protein YcbX
LTNSDFLYGMAALACMGLAAAAELVGGGCKEVTVSALYVYPIKSCGGVSLQEADFDRLGFSLDRRWMLAYRKSNNMATMRDMPKMALIYTALQGGRVYVSAPGMPDLQLPDFCDGAETVEVKVWDDTISVETVSNECDQWFSAFLGNDVVLMRTRPDADHHRPLDSKYDCAPADLHIQAALADGFPFLLASEESLADVNRRINDPVSMANFRPNIVVKNCPVPFGEDSWRRILIAGGGNSPPTEFAVVKACDRCSMPQVDPVLGVRRKDQQPVTALRSFRGTKTGVIFGQNLIQLQATGSVRVGSTITVLEMKFFPDVGVLDEMKKKAA